MDHFLSGILVVIIAPFFSYLVKFFHLLLQVV